MNSSGDDDKIKIKEISVFNQDGSFNKSLFTKEGFVNSIFESLIDKEDSMLKENFDNAPDECCYEAALNNLYDAIANLNDDCKMSEDEIKFIASFGKNSDKNTISLDDFYDLGVVGRDINKYDEANSGVPFGCFEPYIEAQTIVEQPPKITAVNDELKIDGQIKEPVIQGNVGDCWFLAGINALNSTDKGKEIIRNSIIPSDDGTVTVNFAGVQKQITITPEEIKEHDTDTNFQDMYSNGDNDALVLEIGMRKLIKENPTLFEGSNKGLNGGQNYTTFKALVPNYKIFNISERNEVISGINKNDESNQKGVASTQEGVNSKYSEKVKEIFIKALNNKNIAMSFSDGQHSMAITEVKDNKITYIDSMAYKTTTISWDEFINQFRELSYIDLSNN